MRNLVLSLVFILSFPLTSCNSDKKNISKSYSENYLSKLLKIETKVKNINLSTYVAISDKEQMHGLSAIKPKFFSTTDSMLFFNESTQPRSFWMPDTHFNLDIFFLDSDLKVVGIDRNAPHHPGRSENPPIYRTGFYECMHVLELKHSNISKKINIGDKLTLKNPGDLVQIKSKIRQQL